MIVLHLILLILFLYLGGAAVYLFVFAVAGHHPRSRRDEALPHGETTARILVMIPGYKEDDVILHTARHTLTLAYPDPQWELMIIADSMKPETLNTLRAMPLTLVEVSFEKSTKSKALNHAMSGIKSEFDVALILDADNLAAADFLQKVNQAYQGGFMAIQGRRMAKNLNSTIAILDAMSEEINNHIFSSGHRALNLSSRLAGSGMAFDFQLFKKTMAGIHAIGGFDKELELTLIEKGYQVAYLPSAVVYDEKVAVLSHFGNQRRRWIAAQFHYASRLFGKALVALLTRRKTDFFDKATQMLLPPRLILPGALLLGGIICLGLGAMDWAIAWGIAFGVNAVAFAISIPGYLYKIKYLKALASLPRAFGIMILSLLKIRGANNSFIHTPHGTTEMTDVQSGPE